MPNASDVHNNDNAPYIYLMYATLFLFVRGISKNVRPAAGNQYYTAELRYLKS
jgi:hypothetical protein